MSRWLGPWKKVARIPMKLLLKHLCRNPFRKQSQMHSSQPRSSKTHPSKAPLGGVLLALLCFGGGGMAGADFVVASGTRHRGFVDALPKSKSPVPPNNSQNGIRKKVAPLPNSTATGNQTTLPARTTPASDSVDGLTKTAQCGFTVETGFNTWRFVDAVRATDTHWFVLAQNLLERRPRSQLLELDTQHSKLSLVSQASDAFTAITKNPRTGDIAAVHASRGLWVYREKTKDWNSFFSDTTVTSFAWGDKATGWATRTVQSGKATVHELASVDTRIPKWSAPLLSQNESLLIADAQPKKNAVLLITRTGTRNSKNSPEPHSELWLWTPAEKKRLSSDPNIYQAVFSADSEHAIVLLDRGAKSGAVWLYSTASKSNPTTNSRPLSAETNPVESIRISDDKTILVVTTQDAGIRTPKVYSIDGAGAYSAELPIPEHANLFLRHLFPISQSNLQLTAFAVGANLEIPDNFISIGGNTTTQVWSPKIQTGCLKKWTRTSAKSLDGSPIVVDVFEPAIEASAGTANANQVLQFANPMGLRHEPSYSPVRQYWLQRGWTVFEPHLKHSKATLRADIKTVAAMQFQEFQNQPKDQRLLSELSREEMGDSEIDSQMDYRCAFGEGGTAKTCSALDLARLILKQPRPSKP
jgi:hypothetical protein